MKHFTERLNSLDCSQDIRDVVECIRQTVDRNGVVVWIDHSAKNGWGTRAKVGRRAVCRIDPKPVAGHVCVSIYGASAEDLSSAGRVHIRKEADPWVDVKTLEGARSLEPTIIRAFFAAQGEGSAIRRRRKAPTALSRPIAVAVSEVVLGRSPANATADQTVREYLSGLGFAHIGVIAPMSRAPGCEFRWLAPELLGTAVYALVVEGALKKQETPVARTRRSASECTPAHAR
jgi:hypothetical protein